MKIKNHHYSVDNLSPNIGDAVIIKKGGRKKVRHVVKIPVGKKEISLHEAKRLNAKRVSSTTKLKDYSPKVNLEIGDEFIYGTAKMKVMEILVLDNKEIRIISDKGWTQEFPIKLKETIKIVDNIQSYNYVL